MSFTNTSFTPNLNETEWFGIPYPSANVTNQTLLNFTKTDITNVSEEEGPSLALIIFSYFLIVVLCGFLLICVCCLTGIVLMECLENQNITYIGTNPMERTTPLNKEISLEPGAKKLIAETPIDNILLPSGEDNLEWANITCSICLEEIDFSVEAEKKITQLSCGHMYHQECISEWYFGGVTSVSKCPLCRERMDHVVITVDSI